MIASERIARALGDAHRSSSGWWTTKCPVCGGEGKCGVKVDERGVGERGVGVHCYRGCCCKAIVAEIDRLGLLESGVVADPQPTPEETRRQTEEGAAKRRQKIATAHDIWLTSVSAYATSQIPTYFASRELDPEKIPESIRLHGMHGPYGLHAPSGERRPSMVALIEHVEHGIGGVSQTFLTIDGSSKACFAKPRLFTGVVKGGAVHLGELQPDQWLVIAEGIETTLSAMRLFNEPTGWAALSANGLKALVLPHAAQKVLICADGDAVGQRAALAAAWRFGREGRRVQVEIPPLRGDFNDLLMQGSRHAA